MTLQVAAIRFVVAFQVIVVGVAGVLRDGLLAFGTVTEQRDAHGFGDFVCDLVLHREDVVERAVIGLRPQVIAVLGVDQLRSDTNLHTAFLHAAFQHVCDPQLLADAAQVFIAILERE